MNASRARMRRSCSALSRSAALTQALRFSALPSDTAMRPASRRSASTEADNRSRFFTRSWYASPTFVGRSLTIASIIISAAPAGSGVRAGLRPGHDLSHHLRLRVGVLLHVLPRPRGELALGRGVALAVGRVRSQVVPEQQHPVQLLAARREHMYVHDRVWPVEHPMLEPVGLADAEDVTRRLHAGHVRDLVRRVRPPHAAVG